MRRDHITTAGRARTRAGRSGERAARARPIFAGSLCALALAFSALHVSLARANEMAVFSCHEPSGALAGDYGWGQERFVNGVGAVLEDTCAPEGAGALFAYLGGQTSGYANLERVQWTFTAPPWAAITHYALKLAESYAYPSHGAGEGQTYVIASDESDPNYDYRQLGTGAQGPATIERTPPDEVHSLTLNASCDGFLGPCPGDTFIARIALSQATFVLSDPTLPELKSISGSLLAGAPLAGVLEARFLAADAGPGIYGAHFVVDGQVQPTVVLDSNGGLCAELGQTSDGTRSFQSSEPCAKEVEGAITLDTRSWPDGAHHVQLLVEDASGNAVSAYDATVVFHNTPSGLTGAGQPNGAGASDAASIHLAGKPRIHRTYARRAFTLRGALTNTQGQPIEGATLDVLAQTLGSSQTQVIGDVLTGKGGAFLAKVRGGPSRTVQIAYRAFSEDTVYAAQAGVSESVGAGVKLRASPSSTSPDGTVVLSGRVLGSIPRHGVLTELLVHYRGRWEPIRDPRTNAKGRFRVVYRFAGALGRFPFKVRVPEGQSGFPFASGQSGAVDVFTG